MNKSSKVVQASNSCKDLLLARNSQVDLSTIYDSRLIGATFGKNYKIPKKRFDSVAIQRTRIYDAACCLHAAKATTPLRILEVGCGYSTRPFRLSKIKAHWDLLDFETVLQNWHKSFTDEELQKFNIKILEDNFCNFFAAGKLEGNYDLVLFEGSAPWIDLEIFCKFLSLPNKIPSYFSVLDNSRKSPHRWVEEDWLKTDRATRVTPYCHLKNEIVYFSSIF